MCVTDHRRSARRVVGHAELALESDAVVRHERHGLHRFCDDASDGGAAATDRHRVHDPRPAAVARRRGDRARGRVARLRGRAAPRDRCARHAGHARSGLAGETSALLLGTGVIPMGARTSKLAAMAAATVQERSGGRHLLGVGTGGRGAGGARPAPDLRGGDPRPDRRERSRLRPPAPAPGSRPDLDRGARSEGDPSRRRDRRRRDPQLVHAGSRGGGPRRDPGGGRRSGPRPGLGHDLGLRARRVLRSCG